MAECGSVLGSGCADVVGGELGANSLSVETETLDVHRRVRRSTMSAIHIESRPRWSAAIGFGDWSTKGFEREPEASLTPGVQQLALHSKPVRVLEVMQKYIGVNKMECDTTSGDYIDARAW